MSAGLVMPFWHQPRPIHSRWARVKKKVSAMQLHCLLLFWVLYSNNLKSNSCPHAGCTCDGTAPRILADEGRAWVHRDLFRSLLLAGKSASMSGSDDEDLADQFLIGFEDGVTCLIVISIFMSPNVLWYLLYLFSHMFILFDMLYFSQVDTYGNISRLVHSQTLRLNQPLE